MTGFSSLQKFKMNKADDDQQLFGECEIEDDLQITIPGLVYLHQRISSESCEMILEQISKYHWFSPPVRNQFMRFGPILPCLQELENIGMDIFPKSIASR